MERRLATLLLALGLLFAAVPAAAQGAARAYTGTLGSAPIVLELFFDGHGAVTHGRYFYTRHHLDLMLEPETPQADHVVLEESAGDQAKPRITLDRAPNGGWRGTWRNPQGKTLPVALVPAKPSAPAADAPAYLRKLATQRPYDYLRLAGLKLAAGKRETFMGHTLQWYREPVSGITLFEIVDSYPDTQRAAINRVLVDRLWQETNSWFTCRDNHFGEGDYDQTVTPRLLTADLVSISVFTRYYCGGAHPDFSDVPINLDARTVAPLTLEDLLWVGTGAPLHYVQTADDGLAHGSASFKTWAAYRDQQLAPWLATQWKALYPREMQPDGKDDCDYTSPDVWQSVGWHLTPQGIFIGPSFARFARNCEANDDWSVLPWRIVRQHPGRLRLTLPQ